MKTRRTTTFLRALTGSWAMRRPATLFSCTVRRSLCVKAPCFWVLYVLARGAALADTLNLRLRNTDSGHGGSMPDDSGDEADGKDETMVPLDYQRCVPVGWATALCCCQKHRQLDSLTSAASLGTGWRAVESAQILRVIFLKITCKIWARSTAHRPVVLPGRKQGGARICSRPRYRGNTVPRSCRP